MPSPNKGETKLEPRTTHVPKVGHEKNPKGYEISHKTLNQSTQPRKPRTKLIPWPGTDGERYGLEENDMDWKIGPIQKIWTKYGPIRNAKMQYGNVTPI